MNYYLKINNFKVTNYIQNQFGKIVCLDENLSKSFRKLFIVIKKPINLPYTLYPITLLIF